MIFVHPYDDPLVIAGQGTVGLEMLAVVPALDTLVVPIGGGGLISGIAVVARCAQAIVADRRRPGRALPSMYNAVSGRQLPMRGDTLAEGIAVKSPGRITTEIIRHLVDDIRWSPSRRSSARWQP